MNTRPKTIQNREFCNFILFFGFGIQSCVWNPDKMFGFWMVLLITYAKSHLKPRQWWRDLVLNVQYSGDRNTEHSNNRKIWLANYWKFFTQAMTWITNLTFVIQVMAWITNWKFSIQATNHTTYDLNNKFFVCYFNHDLNNKF